jgi:hypothetical protein
MTDTPTEDPFTLTYEELCGPPTLHEHVTDHWKVEALLSEFDRVMAELDDDPPAPSVPDDCSQLAKERHRLDAPAIEQIPEIMTPTSIERRSRLGAIIAKEREKYRPDAKLMADLAEARRAVDTYRKGEGRDKYNERRRSEYAAGVRSDKNRHVRNYRKATPEGRAAQKKASKMKRAAAMSNAERDVIREKDRLRKLEARIVNAAIVELDME